MRLRPRLAITLGDPCGIGPELLLKSLPTLLDWGEVWVIGARVGLELLAAQGDPSADYRWTWTEPDPDLPRDPALSCHGLELWIGQQPGPLRIGWIDPTPEVGPEQLTLGVGCAISGRCAVEGVRTGAEVVMAGHADAMVTLPLAKSAAHMAGYDIPGHTEFLQELTHSPLIRMGFVSPTLCVVLHTVHQSLRSVVENLNAEAVAETLAFAADRFAQLSGRMEPRVALCALNPHAGERGAFGREEEILSEAILQAEAQFLSFDGQRTNPFGHLPSPFPSGPAPEGWSLYPRRDEEISTPSVQPGLEVVERGPKTHEASFPAPRFFGPYPSDTLFLRAARGEFDLVVALYHDQGLIPIKVLEPDRAVNLTLGLPFIRTSPDHGTAFEIAGRWIADPTDFLEASALAVRLAGRSKGQNWMAEL
ncbi:MAG: pdxA [Holophagaceae bacterium]|nr:pdxA [Holophagaceae bacterium]